MLRDTSMESGNTAMIVAGLLWMVGSIDKFMSGLLLMFPALIALGIALLALNACASRSTSRVAQGVSILAIAANVLAILAYIGAVASFIRETPAQPFFQVLALCLAVLFTLLLVLGFQLQHERLLPRWGGLPLLLNIPAALFLVSSLLGRDLLAEAPSWVGIGVLMIAGLGLLLHGVAMLPPKRQTAPTV